MGPDERQDNRLPLSDVPKLLAGFVDLAGRIITGQDPINAVKQSLANGVVALGVDALREEIAGPPNIPPLS